MNYISAKMEVDVLIPVESSNEKYARLEASYITNPELIVFSNMELIDCNGEKRKVIVNDIINSKLDEFIVNE